MTGHGAAAAARAAGRPPPRLSANHGRRRRAEVRFLFSAIHRLCHAGGSNYALFVPPLQPPRGTICSGGIEKIWVVDLKDGTLLVCFLGDPRGGARPAPRLAIWRERGPLEEVELPEPVARMIGRLSLPPEPNLAGAGARGKADRIVSALGSPLRQRSARELQAALGYKKTQEWRVRQALITTLESHGLGDHLDAGWGRIGLLNTISDVAALVCAVRHGEQERAVRLLETVGDDKPQLVDWVLTEGWWTFVREEAAKALAEAKHWQAEPRHLPARVASIPTTGESLPVPSASALPVPWTSWPLARRPRRRGRRRILAAALLAVGVTGAFALGVFGGSSPGRALFPGSWPTGTGTGYTGARIANLANGVPPELEVAARRGDPLLLRIRLPGTGGPRLRPGPVAVSADLANISSEGIRLYTSTSGFSPELRQGGVRVMTENGDDRLQIMPSTTRLVDTDGEIVRELPDLQFGKWNWVGRLPSPSPYFVDTQLRVVRAAPGTPGQISSDSGVRCDPTESSAQSLEVAVGTVVDCTARLVNFGPSALPNVKLRIGCTASWLPGYGWAYGLRVTARSPSAEPDTTYFSQNVKVSRGRFHGIAYVKGSAELFDASFERRYGDLELRERLSKGELIIGPLEAGVANALFLRFKAHIH